MVYDRKDAYYRKAKEEGYRSRAAYKLMELDQKLRLFKQGQKGVDQGCAPGGWLQVAAAKVGSKGLIVGIDRFATPSLGIAQVQTLEGDISADESVARLKELLTGPADFVLSDMAPDTSGVGFADHVRSVELARLVLDAARKLLKPGGWFVAKVFEGPDLKALVEEIRASFGKVQRIKPASTRKGSRELYLMAAPFV